MNPTIAQMVIHSSQRDIEAAAAQNRLVADAKRASRAGSVRSEAAPRSLLVLIAGIVAAVTR